MLEPVIPTDGLIKDYWFHSCNCIYSALLSHYYDFVFVKLYKCGILFLVLFFAVVEILMKHSGQGRT